MVTLFVVDRGSNSIDRQPSYPPTVPAAPLPAGCAAHCAPPHDIALSRVYICRWTTFWDIQFTGAAVADAPDRYHAINALRHILHAPVWTQRLQAKGTPGRLATWGGNPRAPAMKFFSEAWTTFITNGTGIASGVANMTKALEWFRPRYDAFKADPSKAITFDDVAAVWPQLFEDGAGLSPAGQASLDTTSSGNPTTPAVCNDGLSLADPDGGLLPSCTLAETFTYR